MDMSPDQAAALTKVRAWLARPGQQQIFRLFGYAGTGKTTLARTLADDRPATAFGAFTGKAAAVMRAKGCEEATTIHGLIYRRLADDVSRRPIFVLNDDGPAARASLIIIDECSMVDARLGQDLLSFRRPILVLGDPAQLPPIEGKGYFTKATPDVLLTRIHRQAVGNPVLDLAGRVRAGGGRLREGEHGTSRVIPVRALDLETVLGADQILVGLNDTRNSVNARVRELLGHRGLLPVRGDKLVCLRNDHQRGFLNGEIWFVEAVFAPEVADVVRLAIRPEAGTGTQTVDVPRCLFEGGSYTPTPAQRREVAEFTYGYALTVHKAQGSQWDTVLLFDESAAFGDDAIRFLYTGLTRAAERVTVVLP